MRSVWSYWTKPFTSAQSSTGCHEWHHWLAWGLSLEAACRHYPGTRLYRDDEGARVLIDELELPFEYVSTDLNGIRDEDPEWWSLGKLEAYARQDASFVHVDTDVFLWNSLAPDIEAADVFAQNPEPIFQGSWGYQPEEVERVPGTEGRLPEA
jgi:hypothetical protein